MFRGTHSPGPEPSNRARGEFLFLRSHRSVDLSALRQLRTYLVGEVEHVVTPATHKCAAAA